VKIEIEIFISKCTEVRESVRKNEFTLAEIDALGEALARLGEEVENAGCRLSKDKS